MYHQAITLHCKKKYDTHNMHGCPGTNLPLLSLSWDVCWMCVRVFHNYRPSRCVEGPPPPPSCAFALEPRPKKNELAYCSAAVMVLRRLRFTLRPRASTSRPSGSCLCPSTDCTDCCNSCVVGDADNECDVDSFCTCVQGESFPLRLGCCRYEFEESASTAPKSSMRSPSSLTCTVRDDAEEDGNDGGSTTILAYADGCTTCGTTTTGSVPRRTGTELLGPAAALAPRPCPISAKTRSGVMTPALDDGAISV